MALAPALILWQEIRFESEVHAGDGTTVAPWSRSASEARNRIRFGPTSGMIASFSALWMCPPTAGSALASGLAVASVFITWEGFRRLRSARGAVELEETRWIIRQRGTVQDQMMRACEREAMERRLRRCQSTLMLTRRGGRDLAKLFRLLEKQVAAMEDQVDDAAAIISGFAAHLRHVFMESDRDDIPLGEACDHVARWGRVLEQLGVPTIRISGAPDRDSPHYHCRIPALLLLGAVERIGVKALEAHAPGHIHWAWHFEGDTARLVSAGASQLELPREELRDWDAAFMLRHGGIAHAGGTWTFELPLLPA